MTIFQEQIKERLNNIVQQHNASIVYSAYQCKPNELIGHKEGDVYIEASINKKGLIIKAYIYNDEASVKIERGSFMLEKPDYKNDSILLGKVLVNFIHNLLKGEAPTVAMEIARAN